jgi:mannosyltransferase
VSPDALLVDRPPATQPTPRPWAAYGLRAVVAAAVVTGIALRFTSTGPLWLDEAQSVAIARLPVGAPLFDALRQDSAPPLYYLLLHGWMAVFGDGDLAVRTLSGLFAVAALPLFYLLGRRLGGSAELGGLMVVLCAVNPWLVRYAIETRMYSLVILLAAIAVLAMLRLRSRPASGPAALLAVTGALLLYTHYWSIFLLASFGAVLAWWALRGRRPAGVTGLVALAAAGIAYLPWVPSLIFQSAHTGTPWTGRPQVVRTIQVVWLDWFTGGGRVMPFLLPALAVLLVVGAARLDRWITAVCAGTLVLAFVVCRLQPAAYATRYTSVVVPLVLLLVAAGLAALPGGWSRGAAVVLAVVWMVASIDVVTTPRSHAAQLAAAINRHVRPGDIVVYCPDQLGPAVSRLVEPSVRQVVYPTGGDPGRVNWVDYAERNAAASPTVFATRVVASSRPDTQIWLVRRDGFRTFGNACARITATLSAELGQSPTVVTSGTRYQERATVLRWPPSRTGPTSAR